MDRAEALEGIRQGLEDMKAGRTRPHADAIASWAAAMNVEITALADANLEEVYLRIRKDSPSRAVEWRKGLLKAA